MNHRQMSLCRKLLAYCLLAAATLSGGCSVLEHKQTARVEDRATVEAPKQRTARKPQPVFSQPVPLEPKQVGYYMDVQYANLQQKLNDNDIVVTHDRDKISILIPGATTFDSNSASLKPLIEPTLSLIAGVLSEFDKTRITINGHTDDQGDPDYNLRLSEQRAMAVGRFLSRSNITPGRLVMQGLGHSHPIADNSSPDGRAKNRRVELILEPIVGDNSSFSPTASRVP